MTNADRAELQNKMGERMIYEGNLEITEKNQHKFKNLVEVTGYLSVHSSAKLDAPLLTTVGGDLRVYGSAKLDAPLLTTVGGDLSVHSSAKLDAPLLTTVGGYLSVHSSAKLDALTTVGGDLSVSGCAKLDALTTVGGDLRVYGCAKLPKDLTGNNPKAVSICKKSLELSLKKKGFIKVDGILSWLLSKKKIGITVTFKVRIVGKSKTSYIVQKGDVYAHGETIKQAKESLLYKASVRDVSEFKTWKVTDKKSVTDLISAYRSITGACQQGVEMFLKGKDIEKKMTIKEVIKLTKGQYGSDKFAGFFL